MGQITDVNILAGNAVAVCVANGSASTGISHRWFEAGAGRAPTWKKKKLGVQCCCFACTSHATQPRPRILDSSARRWRGRRRRNGSRDIHLMGSRVVVGVRSALEA